MKNVWLVLLVCHLMGCGQTELYNQMSIIKADQQMLQLRVNKTIKTMETAMSTRAIRMGSIITDKPSRLWEQRDTGRQYRTRVNFDQPFPPGTVPKVLTGISGITTEEASKLQLNTGVLSELVTNSGFTLVLTTGATSISEVNAFWLAYVPENRMELAK